MEFKNHKIVQKIRNIAPRLRWLMYSHIKDIKIGARYIDFLIPDTNKNVCDDSDKLEAMVRHTLTKEFGEKIKDNKSYELLVDATVHNLKKKQLALGGDADYDILDEGNTEE